VQILILNLKMIAHSTYGHFSKIKASFDQFLLDFQLFKAILTEIFQNLIKISLSLFEITLIIAAHAHFKL